MKVSLIKWITEDDWLGIKQRALVTVGKKAVTHPGDDWKSKILAARHSPIRYGMFSFFIEDVPYCISVHLVRHHEGFQPYVRSQRNDRQSEYDRNAARQDAPVNMILDINAEAMMTIANKRLCAKADPTTRALVQAMCEAVIAKNPEFAPYLVPNCEYHGKVCYEMLPCGRNKPYMSAKVSRNEEIS